MSDHNLDKYYELDIDPVDNLPPKVAFYYGIELAQVEVWCAFSRNFQIEVSAGNVDRILSWLRRHHIDAFTEPTEEEGVVSLFGFPRDILEEDHDNNGDSDNSSDETDDE